MKALSAFALLALLLTGCAGGGAGSAQTGKLGPSLQALAANPGATGSVPVIVTLVPSVSAASYTPADMQVAYRFVSLNAVAGVVPVAGLEALAASPEVLRVEEDAEMKTLGL